MATVSKVSAINTSEIYARRREAVVTAKASEPKKQGKPAQKPRSIDPASVYSKRRATSAQSGLVDE